MASFRYRLHERQFFERLCSSRGYSPVSRHLIDLYWDMALDESLASINPDITGWRHMLSLSLYQARWPRSRRLTLREVTLFCWLHIRFVAWEFNSTQQQAFEGKEIDFVSFSNGYGVVACNVNFRILPMGLLPFTLNCGLRMRRECREWLSRYRLQRKPRVSDPAMHNGTCVKHVPW